jgi:hypothetical protein
MRFVHTDARAAGVLPNYVRVQGDAGWLEWDWTANTIRMCCATQHARDVNRVKAGEQGAEGAECVSEERGGEEKTEVVAGDSWVTGGVKDTLADALRQCALYECGRVATYKVDERTHLCAAEEGLRDACVVFCMAHAAAAAAKTAGGQAGARAYAGDAWWPAQQARLCVFPARSRCSI